MRIASALLFALAVVHATPTLLHAQEPEQLSGEVTCAECVITLDTLVTIGGLDGPGLDVISMFSSFAVDRRGRILVSGEAEISVFDSTGRYLRTVGGRGEGPGEYESISHISVGPRYIHVFEYDEGRTMLDYDFQVVRTDRFRGQILYAAVVSDDVAVFASDLLHILRPTGELTSQPPLRATRPALAGRDGTVWVVASEINRLSRWDLVPEPKVGRVFDRRVPEFDGGGDAFAPAGVSSAMLDDRGLWLVWHTSDRDRTEPLPSLRNLGREQIDTDELRDSWLDLVDPATGRTIARYRQDNVLGDFAGGSGYIANYRESDAGVPFLDILVPRLSGR